MAFFQHFLLVALLAQLASFPQARFLARQDPGELADAEVEKLQLDEQLDADKTAAENSDKDEEQTDDTSEAEFDKEEAAVWNTEEVGEDTGDDESFVQVKKEPTEEDPGDLADAEVEKIQVAEQLDTDKTAAENSGDGEEQDEDTSEGAFDREEEAVWSSDVGEDTDDDESFLQVKTKQPTEEDPGELADAEVEKIQVAEQLDADRTGSDTEGAEDEEFDADDEARRAEMYEEPDADADAALVQRKKNKKKDAGAALIQKKDDPDDLADAEVEKIQLAEQLDEDKTAAVSSDGEEDNDSEEEDFDNEARRSEMYDNSEEDDGSALIQQRKKAPKARSLAKDSSQKGQQSKQPSELADAAAEKIQVQEDMDMSAAEKKDMEEAETDAAVQTYDTESSDDAFEANFASSRAQADDE